MPEWEKQIGDRRERNGWKATVPGHQVPCLGSLIGCLCVPKGREAKLCMINAFERVHLKAC